MKVNFYRFNITKTAIKVKKIKYNCKVYKAKL